MSNLNVTPLRETKSKYDIMVRGRMICLELDPCACGVHAKWVVQQSPEEKNLPGFIQEILKTKAVLDEWHWEPKWWQKLMRRKMEVEFEKWVQKKYRRYKAIADDNTLEKLRTRLELPGQQCL